MAKHLSNSYTMVCPPVRGDNPRALAREWIVSRTCRQGIYTTLIRVDLDQYEIFHAKVCDFLQEWYKVLIKQCFPVNYDNLMRA